MPLGVAGWIGGLGNGVPAGEKPADRGAGVGGGNGTAGRGGVLPRSSCMVRTDDLGGAGGGGGVARGAEEAGTLKPDPDNGAGDEGIEGGIGDAGMGIDDFGAGGVVGVGGN